MQQVARGPGIPARSERDPETCHLLVGARVGTCDGEHGARRTTRRWTMYDFAIVALLALATLKLVDFLTDAVAQLRPVRSLLTFVIAIGSALLLDYSVFKGWGMGLRNE